MKNNFTLDVHSSEDSHTIVEEYKNILLNVKTYGRPSLIYEKQIGEANIECWNVVDYAIVKNVLKYLINGNTPAVSFFEFAAGPLFELNAVIWNAVRQEKIRS